MYDATADEDDGINRPSTRNVLLEAANWNYINIRKTLSGQREQGKEISSEAGARFSRGVHPAQSERGLRRAIELMRQLAWVVRSLKALLIITHCRLNQSQPLYL